MIQIEENRILRRYDKELLLIEPWGENSLRVRATQRENFLEDPDLSSLLPREGRQQARVREENGGAVIENGKITCDVTAQEGDRLLLAVPASEGWTARVNGQKAEIRAFEGCLAEIMLEQGANHITMQFRVPGLTAGILLSVSGILLLAVWTRVRSGLKAGGKAAKGTSGEN